MFGHQNLSEQCVSNYQDANAKWKFDLVADTKGYMALLPFGEIKIEMRKNPKPMYKIMELAANHAYETTYYNMTGEKRNQPIIFTHN